MATQPKDRIAEVPRLVSMPREQYLRQQEIKIRSRALPLIKAEPIVAIHLNAVEFAEDIIDVHECAIDRQHAMGAHRIAESHERFRDQAMQLKLHHLDHLEKLTA